MARASAEAAQPTTTVLPGLLLVAAAVVVSVAINLVLPAVSPLLIALVIGVILANVGLDLSRFSKGLSFASRRLLRIAIVFLGLQVSLAQIMGLGAATLVAIVVVVAATFGFSLLMGRLLGVPTDRSLIMASGFSICGASAVAAMGSVTKAEEEDITASIAAVTLFGTICIVLLPVLQVPFGLTDPAFGTWAGLSVHEVAQVVATTAVPGADALATAVPVKLGRVLMLAPVIAITALALRRSRPVGTEVHPPIVPLFVAGFVVAVIIASLDILPDPVLEVARIIQVVLMSAAMFAIGTVVRISRLVRSSGRLLILGALSTIFIVALGYLCVVLIG